MILYAVTINIEPAIHQDWLKWMQEVHIPDVLATGLFIEHKCYQLIDKEHPDKISYTIQYTCPDLETLQKYQQEFAPKLQQEHTARYEGKFTGFRVISKVIVQKKLGEKS